MGERRGVYRLLVWKPEGKRPLGRPRRKLEDNIKMHLQKMGCGGKDWIKLAQLVGTCECGNDPSGSIESGEFLDWLRTGYLLKQDCAVWSEYFSVGGMILPGC
jgi:hypothetical protein